ncbi:acyl-CoA thioesterase-1 [Larkinella arboricola]|uniref:Acyl-CoA thioesterase-1 n=1 Tax=Larkinella arboricola TaxID=643671 RepID=A0A327X5A2_LARAB|nr:arylesterase [Larkinella arboricola]RAK02217.1 acyl-CoA thioesterase-1 [Larkinella arboricola]
MNLLKNKLSHKVLLGAWLLVSSMAGCNSKTETNQAQEEKPEATASQSEKPASEKKKTILFFGNSLTAGYGLDPAEAFPALVGEKAKAAGYDYQVVNAGSSGETTAGGKSRISWVLRKPVDVFVLELGGNDGLRGIPIKDSQKNLQAIIDTVRQKSPQAQIVLAGMQIPPNLGPDYSEQFKTMYTDLADKNKLTLIPFLLENVGGIRKLNQPDGIHPTAEGHKIVAENVWKVLEPVLQKQQL